MKNQLDGMTIKHSVAIILLSSMLALTYNSLSPRGLPLIRKPIQRTAVSDAEIFQKQPAADAVTIDGTPVTEFPVNTPKQDSALSAPAQRHETPAAAVSADEFRIISLEQLQRLREEGSGILLDARNPDEFSKGHIKGALNIPYMEVAAYFEQIVQFPQDTLVIVYCTNPDCYLGRGLIKFMRDFGLSNIVLYDEGWDAWKDAGMPFVTGAKDSLK